MTPSPNLDTPTTQPLVGPSFSLEEISPVEEAHGLAIVVADRGWVWIGVAATAGNWTRVVGARCIRRWGTTRGLGELVTGPTPDTRLDDPADVKVATKAVIAIIPVEADKWPTA